MTTKIGPLSIQPTKWARNPDGKLQRCNPEPISHDAPGFKKLARAYVTEMVISGKTLVMIRDNAIWDIYSMDMPLISNKAKFDFALKTAILNVVQERLVILSTAHGGVFGLAEATLLESLPEEGKADNGTNKGVKDDEVLDLITFE